MDCFPLNTTKFGENFDFYGGIDLRYYKGLHQNVITDLFGGSYFVDIDNRKNVRVENNAAAADPNFKNQKLGVGDVIYRDYDGFVMSEGVFAQLEYNYDKLSAFVSRRSFKYQLLALRPSVLRQGTCQVRQETLPGRKRQRRY